MSNPKGAGRKRIEIDYAKLDSLCAILCTGEEIASILNISYDTLDRALKRDKKTNFAEYYKKKSANGKASLRRRQYKSAVEDKNVTMQIWLGKQYLGQKDKTETALTGADGGAIQWDITVHEPKH